MQAHTPASGRLRMFKDRPAPGSSACTVICTPCLEYYRAWIVLHVLRVLANFSARMWTAWFNMEAAPTCAHMEPQQSTSASPRRVYWHTLHSGLRVFAQGLVVVTA